jgi:hypothetical protein
VRWQRIEMLLEDEVMIFMIVNKLSTGLPTTRRSSFHCFVLTPLRSVLILVGLYIISVLCVNQSPRSASLVHSFVG